MGVIGDVLDFDEWRVWYPHASRIVIHPQYDRSGKLSIHSMTDLVCSRLLCVVRRYIADGSRRRNIEKKIRCIHYFFSRCPDALAKHGDESYGGMPWRAGALG